MNAEDHEFRDDPEARALAARLAKTDFAADGRAGRRVRARLKAGPRREARAARGLAAASLAAALAVLVLPFALKGPSAPPPQFPRGPEGLPVLSGRLPAWGAGAPETVIETRRVTIDDLIVKRKF